MTLIKILGSLSFAIALIAVLALVLIASTSLESLYGTSFAQKFFYETGWFDVLLGLLVVNIVCSTILRFPFKKKHTGFIITHIGILMILAGSFLTRFFGVDGQIMVFEGEQQAQIIQNKYELLLHSPETGHVERFDLAVRAGARRQTLKNLGNGAAITLDRVWDNAVEKNEIAEGPPGTPPNPAVELSLQSERVGLQNNFWLVKNDPLDPDSGEISMGPATFALKDKPVEGAATIPAGTAQLIVRSDKTGDETAVDLKNIPTGDTPIGKSGFRIVGIQYYPDARVGENNQIVNGSNEPVNPAVLFHIYDAEGRHERHIRFALYPDFESMHEKEGQGRFALSYDLRVDAQKEKPSGSQPALWIYAGKDSWSYESRSSQGAMNGKLEAGKTYATGWMDFKFRAERLLDHAVVNRMVKQADKSEKGGLAVQIAIMKDGNVSETEWLLADKPKALSIPGGQILAAVRQKVTDVPFSLKLKDFRKVDYPGTHQAASYESDVSLHDPAENLTIEKTIRMNKPLDYKGYRIFQSSYIQDPAQGEASVFTVSKSPGVFLIYSGACVLFSGVFMVFFVKPFSSLMTKEN